MKMKSLVVDHAARQRSVALCLTLWCASRLSSGGRYFEAPDVLVIPDSPLIVDRARSVILMPAWCGEGCISSREWVTVFLQALAAFYGLDQRRAVGAWSISPDGQPQKDLTVTVGRAAERIQHWPVPWPIPVAAPAHSKEAPHA